jgi:DNA repair exonuclease SbcCD ATPase subunit
MPSQLMTYDDLAATWGVSREAARKKVEALHLPRQTGNDGKARIMIDLAEVEHRPLPSRRDRRPGGDRAETEALQEHVKTLRAEVERLAALAESHRADFERERGRAEKAMAEVIELAAKLVEAERAKAEKIVNFEKARAETDEARAETARLRAELAEWRARPWWRRAFG